HILGVNFHRGFNVGYGFRSPPNTPESPAASILQTLAIFAGLLGQVRYRSYSGIHPLMYAAGATLIESQRRFYMFADDTMEPFSRKFTRRDRWTARLGEPRTGSLHLLEYLEARALLS